MRKKYEQSFSDWAPGEPGDSYGQEDCAFMWKLRDYKWNDDRCSNSRNYICKARAKVLKVLFKFSFSHKNLEKVFALFKKKVLTFYILNIVECLTTDK